MKKVTAIEGGLLVELESFSNKIDIVREKGILRGINLWIEDHYTLSEKEVQECLGKIAKDKRERDLETKVKYQKVYVDGEWYEWNEKKGEIEQSSFQEGKGKINLKYYLGTLQELKTR